MNNTHLKKRAGYLAGDVDNIIDELIVEIEGLESLLDQKDDEITNLEKTIEQLHDEIYNLKNQ